MENVEITLKRLEEQITWYDQRSLQSQKWYKRLKNVVLFASAIIPLVALSLSPALSGHLTAALGVIIVISEGLLHLNQYHHNWITYRTTCESLRHEKYLYQVGAGPYSEASANLLLAERIESLISQENTKWVSVQRNIALNSKNAQALR